MKKRKILMLSDHALSTSGVGCQSRFLANGLLTTGKWSIRQFGAALKHDSYDVVQVHEDFIIKPIDGFGDPNMLRIAIATEKPDVLLIFTDPRFFVWLWEMEDEIHQMCPIAYWHVWDNAPYPSFNNQFYEATDLINCHSFHTYSQLKDRFPDRTNFIPHALPPELFYPLPDHQIRSWKEKILGVHNRNAFTAFWVNRNAKRKRPADVIWAWKLFVDKLENREDAILLMHTDPNDQEGPNLFAVAENLGILDRIMFSPDRVDFEKMNILHNISDCCVNIAYAEGFGLATLEAMQVGNPIIAAKTGGLTRQVIDHRDGSENGVALDIRNKTLVGSQGVPYIYEDYASVEETADALFKLFKMGESERELLGQKVRNYALDEFAIEDTVKLWDESLTKLCDDWEAGKRTTPRFEIRELTP
jgi:glycosyltransferase involved in cell wall biosynthesis